MLVVTAEITAYDATIPGTRTLRYSTHGYVSGPTETPANTYWDNRIIQGGNFQRTMFQDQQTFGRTQLGFGELVLANFDGGLDALLDYIFGGRQIIIRLADVNPGVVPTWTTIIDGLIEQAELSWQQVRFRVRDKQLSIAKPLQQVRYGGTNALPAGLDGVAGDLKGRPKPLVYGQVFNAPAPCVNTTRKIYQLHDGSALQSVDAVYNRGVALTAGAAYSSQADMETTAPAAGQYRVWNSAAGCFVRLADNTQGTLTFDATQGAAAANRTVGQLWSQVLQKAGVPVGSISAADITALDAAVAFPCGVFVTDARDVSAIEVVDQLVASVGAWYGVDAAGTFRMARVVLPNPANSVGTITAVNIINIERVASRDAGAGMPAWKVKLGYQRIWETQTDLNTGVTEVRKEYLAQEYRRVEASDAAVLTANPTSPEIEINTLLVAEADAAAEAARRLDIYKARRDFYRVTVRLDSTALASALDLGKTVTLQVARFGMNSGKAFVITGLQADLRQYLFTLTLWG